MGDRCVYSALVSLTSFPMVPDLQGTNENTKGRSQNNANYPILESATVVPSAAVHDNRLPNTSPKHSGSTDPFSKLWLSSEGQSTISGHLEGIRRHLASRKISTAATKLILASWRDTTNANYNSAWKKWEKWCGEQDVPPFAADVSAVLSFLTHEFEEGKQYRSLNCYCSAISSTHLPIKRVPVGQHPLVIRLLKGAFNLRPPKPRYSHTWVYLWC